MKQSKIDAGDRLLILGVYKLYIQSRKTYFQKFGKVQVLRSENVIGGGCQGAPRETRA